MNSNYPPGVTGGEDYFQAPISDIPRCLILDCNKPMRVLKSKIVDVYYIGHVRELNAIKANLELEKRRPA